MMTHEHFVVHVIPINSIESYIFHSILIFVSIMMWTIKTMRTILKHAKKEHLLWSLLRFSLDLELVVIPSFCPGEGISIDIAEEKVVEQPDVSRVVDIKPFTGF